MKTNGLRWHSFKKWWIFFTGDLYSMYVVLQGIGSPSCMIIIYVIPFGEQQSWMSEVRKLERFNKKTAPPKWSISFHIVFKKWGFQAHRRVPPTNGVGELWKKNEFAMKTNGISWCSHKRWLTIFAGNVQNCYRKVKNLYGKIMNLSGNMKEFIWKQYGKVKNL